MSRTHLYLVVADDFDGTPHGNDLFVRAAHAEEAIEMWRQYYDFGQDELNPLYVDLIPSEPRKGAIAWTDVPCVWGNSGR
jgi:hypothetical protein